MTTDIDMVRLTQCRQCLDRQGAEGVRYAVEVVNNRPPALIALPPTLFNRPNFRSLAGHSPHKR